MAHRPRADRRAARLRPRLGGAAGRHRRARPAATGLPRRLQAAGADHQQDRRRPAALHHLGVRLRASWAAPSPSGCTPSPASSVMAQKKNPDALELLRATGPRSDRAGRPRRRTCWPACRWATTATRARSKSGARSASTRRWPPWPPCAPRWPPSASTRSACCRGARQLLEHHRPGRRHRPTHRRRLPADVRHCRRAGRRLDRAQGSPSTSLTRRDHRRRRRRAPGCRSRSPTPRSRTRSIPARALAPRTHIGGAAPAEMARLLAARRPTLAAAASLGRGPATRASPPPAPRRTWRSGVRSGARGRAA